MSDEETESILSTDAVPSSRIHFRMSDDDDGPSARDLLYSLMRRGRARVLARRCIPL